MGIISSKAALTITTAKWRWLHESAWEAEHFSFAENCPCFAGQSLQRMTWVSPGGVGRPAALGTTFSREGRWILQLMESQQMVGAAELEWESGTYDGGWLFFEDTADAMTEAINPALWLMEAVIQALRPDFMTVQGLRAEAYRELQTISDTRKIAVPSVGGQQLAPIEIQRIDMEAWHEFPAAAPARTELSWLRKRADRERKMITANRDKRERPWLIKVLIALSPVRRRNNSKMIHPLDWHRHGSR